MERIYDICCGIDVHKKILTCCLRKKRKKVIKEFGTTTNELHDLCKWLKENKCQQVAMESTASYWKPIYNILEIYKIPSIVVNARHMKAVPGRKSDPYDASWISKLLQHGLLMASYIPDKAQREMRELVGYRKSLVEDRTRELNRLQKMLEGCNIKISGTLSEIGGLSAQAIIKEFLEGGTITEERLEEMKKAKLISPRLKASYEQIQKDMNGVITPVQKIMILEVLKHIKELNEHVAFLDDAIGKNLSEKEEKAIEAICEMPGIARDSARAIVSVIGTDMNRFPTDGHLSSWAGVSPGNNQSAGKNRYGKTTKGNKLLRTTLITCAHAAVRNKTSYFYAQFTRISAHRGSNRAYMAVAHSMLIAIYHILKDDVPYRDLGADYYNKFNTERKVKGYLKKLEKLGCTGLDSVKFQTA